MKHAGSPIRCSLFAIRDSRGAMTLVELLVVMVIISILIGSVMVVTTTLIERGRINNTKTVLQNVSDALEAFRRDQETRPTITKSTFVLRGESVRYRERYGMYPPDELERFAGSGSLAPGGAMVSVDPPYEAMDFHTTADPVHDAAEFRDLSAMIIALETLSEEAAMILSRIPDRFRTAGVLDSSDEPVVFLDRKDEDGRLNGDWGPEDLQIRPIVDAWGQPLGYMSQRDGVDLDRSSDNYPGPFGWNHLSTRIVNLQGGNPLIFSYGPDGEQQLTQEAMGGNGAASLPGDYAANDEPDGTGDVDHHLNADNVYLDPTLAERLAKGLE